MTMPRRTTRIKQFEEVPNFATEAEEADYWATHGLSEELLARMEPLGNDVLPRPRQSTVSVAVPLSVRFDEDVLQRLRALAAIKRMSYQRLLKAFVIERLYEEEQREGVIPPGEHSSRTRKTKRAEYLRRRASVAGPSRPAAASPR
jgi:hypothetical protein